MRVIGTWKDRLDHSASTRLARQLAGWLETRELAIELTVCPSTIALASVREILPEQVSVGGQNVRWEAPHALTGETRASVLKALGCATCLVGHSERRVYLGETDEQVARKVEALLESHVVPLICLGETYEERTSGSTAQVLERQIQSLLPHLAGLEKATDVVIAYEPAWAITTSAQAMPASPELAAEDHAWIRDFLRREAGEAAAEIPLIYGAGVKASNVESFLSTPNVDGVLVGGASQEFNTFVELLSIAAGAVPA